LQTNIVAAIEAANKIKVIAEADGDVFDKIGWTAEQAAEYARTHVDDLLQGIDQTTQQLIGDAVARGIEEQLGVAGTAQLIEELVDGMSDARAEMIATTEMADAMSQAFLEKLLKNDVEYKQWILGPDPCAICEENESASPIPIDEDFPSGDDAPPAHPNCVCAVAGARAPAEED
jgi:polyhydroxyalkanoate synthesis regulator phasin